MSKKENNRDLIRIIEEATRLLKVEREVFDVDLEKQDGKSTKNK